jgi:hypothetical protein
LPAAALPMAAAYFAAAGAAGTAAGALFVSDQT